MKRRHKFYLKLNIMSIIFLVISFSSVTLAWFAYSGLSHVETEIDVNAWYIELEQNGETVSNEIVISVTDIYPGMTSVDETISINNLGDSDASVAYEIVSARILGEAEDNYEVNGTTVTSEEVEDTLSHDYPFNININLERGYVLSGGDPSNLKVSISWPLDSDQDEEDSNWGTDAYLFQESEQDKKDLDPQYEMKSSIQIVLSVTAEQYLNEDTSSDVDYNLGDELLFDVVNNATCTTASATCLEMTVIDVDNKVGDTIVTLLPDLDSVASSDTYDNYSSKLSSITTTWTVTSRALAIGDVMNVVARDISDSVLVRSGLSNAIIGKLDYGTRMNTELTKAITYSGYYKFLNTGFNFFSKANCYWINKEYDSSNGFAVKQIDSTDTKVYSELKTSSCNVIPIVEASKTNL